MWRNLNRIAFAPEGGTEGSSGEADKGADKTATGSHDESTAADRGETEKAKIPERPEWAPENFWDKEKGELRTEELAKGFNETKKKLSMRSDDLVKTLKEDFDKGRLAARPEKPEMYELRLPKELPQDSWQWNESDPLVAFARNHAFENGMSQDQFDGLVGAYVESKLAEFPDPVVEVKRLGEKGQERVERIDNWLLANVSPGAYSALSSVATKAEVLVAIEELMQKSGAPAFAVDTNLTTGDQEVMSDALVRTWMADERYWNPQKRDNNFIAKVEKAWQKLYPSKK